MSRERDEQEQPDEVDRAWQLLEGGDPAGALRLAERLGAGADDEQRADLLFGPLVRQLALKLKRPLSSIAAIYVDGVGMSPVYVRPRMHVKIVLRK